MVRFDDVGSTFYSVYIYVDTELESLSSGSWSTLTPSVTHHNYRPDRLNFTSRCSGHKFSSTNYGVNTVSEILSDTGEAIRKVVATVTNPPVSWKKRATEITTKLSRAAIKMMDAVENDLDTREANIKKMLKQKEEDEKIRRQMQIRSEMAKAREECADVAGLWRQGYS